MPIKRIHEVFQASYVSASISASATKDFLLRTGSYETIVDLGFEGTGEFTCKIFEKATISAGGTGTNIPAIAKNRTYTPPNEVSAFVGPNVTASGTEIGFFRTKKLLEDFTLDENSDHVVRLTNPADLSTEDVSVRFDFEELR